MSVFFRNGETRFRGLREGRSNWRFLADRLFNYNADFSPLASRFLRMRTSLFMKRFQTHSTLLISNTLFGELP